MEKKSKKDNKQANVYRGVTMDEANDNKVSAKRVKADVAELNNNPRSNDIDN